MNISLQKNIFALFAISVFSLVVSFNAAFAQSQELISSWNGDAVSEGIAADVIDGNNGTILGGVTLFPEENGNVFKFDGYSGRINVGDPDSLNFGTDSSFSDVGNSASLNFGTDGPFSLEVWFNWDGGGDHVNIIRKSNYNADNPAGYWLRVLSPLASGLDDNNLEFFTGDTVGIGEPSGRVTTPIDPNTWYHAIATRDSAGTMKLYLNDELVGTASAPDAETTSEAPFTIGAWDYRFGATEFFSGMIGEVTVYSEALNSSEVELVDDEDPEKIEEIEKIEKILAPFIKKGQTPGQCESYNECLAYCNIEANFSECAEFAEKIGLDEQEIPLDQQPILVAIQNGEAPGGCKDEVSCRDYCENIDNLKECLDFIEKFNLVSLGELSEMRKMVQAHDAGVLFPGDCKDKEDCFKYCEDAARVIECMEFAQKAGLLAEEDVEAVSKILPYLKSGGKLPGGCTTKESCDVYCESDNNTNECIDFAVEAGFIPREEAEAIKKVGGKGPGNCKSKEACENYCKDEAHVDECIDFALRAGLISEEDAAMAKKFGISSGPGDCKSKAECESFCVLPENQATCSNWAKEHGMEGEVGGPGGGGFSGPGGCKNQEECTAYCTANQGDAACKQTGGEPGGIEECTKQGGAWNGTSCDFSGVGNTEQGAATECTKQGGNWDGTNCNFLPPTNESSDPSQVPQGYSSWEEFCKAQQ
ncbi:MAG: LamG domain-containing protein, partial [Patescibacteria group bacterium]